MKAIRTLIVDDEPLAREGVRMLLEPIDDVEILGEASNGAQAIGMIEKLQPDLVFLDVQMPGMTGIELLQALDLKRMPEVIFVTAYDRYALRAFEHHALDYLLKPFDDDRFLAALETARKRLRERDADRLGKRLVALLEDFGATGLLDQAAATESTPSPPAETNAGSERLTVKSGGRVYFLRMSEIDWIEAADYYVKLHVGDKEHLMRESMAKLEKRLDAKQFLRIHRSSIVNLDRVKMLQSGRGNEYTVVLQDGTKLTLSRSRREHLNSMLRRRE